MLTVVLRSLLQEYRTRRMARFAVWVLAYGAAVWVLDRFGGGAPGLLWILFWITFIPSLAYYLYRLGGFVRQRLLWRLRRRLIVTYIFIAVVPILLIVLLVGLGAYIINAQFAAFLIALNLRDHLNQLRQLNRVVIHESRLTRAPSPEALISDLERLYANELSTHTAGYPDLEITVRVGALVRAFRLNGERLEKPVTVPVWLKPEEFAEIVMDQGVVGLRAGERTSTPVGELTVILSQPFTPGLLDQLGMGIGPVGLLTPRGGPVPGGGGAATSGTSLRTAETEYANGATIRSKSLRLAEPVNLLDPTVVGTSTLEPLLWGGQTAQRIREPVILFVTSRISTLNREMLAPLGRFYRVYVIAFVAVALIFLVIELVALVIGIRLTRTITHTVDRLYDATERVKTGDFSYRIGLPARDQLSALGEAFDSMTASVERLLRESQEKLRLESELGIAREVQTQLFPQEVPEVRGLQLYGVCKPARVVSGDYYDFLQLGRDRVGLVLGDVSGKGISAALLMAAIQSSLHAQYSNAISPEGVYAAAPISTAQVVARLNRQLYESTSREKYATFFHAVYDGATRRLTYTNAGHLPPVLFRGDAIERLDKGGTAVGLFSDSQYEQAVIQLEPGDLLLAFSDGITEPENIYGEQFGEERVLEVARRTLVCSPQVLVEEIYRTVSDWTGSPELQDDMTLLAAKAVS